MSYEILVGLNVIDDLKYEQYRVAMKPILSDYQGRFGYDFRVSEVLITEVSHDINRVFTINFETKSNMDGFFLNPDYLNIKETFFNTSVKDMTIISSYET